ncbi:hypothetical protein GGS23DRAFT_621096 [Durotheca rogersii]|uniref:uncharacterized protein n=1 Tax=Durotheca rogersii TaxID=419775 RepID=UPI00222031AB|nr:uncharacterized protein GGS23DRAFT_621096 [Durotheca rogersii]KAI5863452.1 hypothetical protein GGS23DRAFT_621096 [Durotheca rogersii]
MASTTASRAVPGCSALWRAPAFARRGALLAAVRRACPAGGSTPARGAHAKAAAKAARSSAPTTKPPPTKPPPTKPAAKGAAKPSGGAAAAAPAPPARPAPAHAADPAPAADPAKPLVLEKPERFNPPSHGARLPRATPRHYGGAPGADEVAAQAARSYPGLPPPPNTWAHRFIHSRGIHLCITLGTLGSLAVYTFAANFRATSPYADMVPPLADLPRDPLAYARLAFEALRLHEQHQAALAGETRRQRADDLLKRNEYRRAHGLEPATRGFFGGAGEIRTPGPAPPAAPADPADVGSPVAAVAAQEPPPPPLPPVAAEVAAEAPETAPAAPVEAAPVEATPDGKRKKYFGIF